MNFIRRLFARTADRPAMEGTVLFDLVSRLTPDTAAGIMESKTLSLSARMPSAMTVMIFWHAHQHYDGLCKLSMVIPGGSLKPEHYDITIFEIAAYLHWFLLRDYLAYSENDDAQADDPDGYTKMVLGSLHHSAAFLKGRTAFTVPDRFFVNRACSYSTIRRESIRETAGIFERRLISSLMKGAPATQKEMSLGDLSIEVAAKAEIGILHSVTLPALETTAKQLFQKATRHQT